jgi:hypothetical protein
MLACCVFCASFEALNFMLTSKEITLCMSEIVGAHCACAISAVRNVHVRDCAQVRASRIPPGARRADECCRSAQVEIYS